MASLYKIQPLLESGFNFGVIFPEKQKSLQEHSGFNFGLQEIALLIKKQTHNFADKNDIALDIDKYLFEAYEKYKDATEPKEEKKEEPKKEFSVEEKVKSFTGKINGYKIKLKRASAEDAEKIAKKIKGYEIKLKGLAIKKKNGGTVLEKGGDLRKGYTFKVQGVEEYNSTATPIMKFYHEGGERDGEERKSGYVLIWKHEQGGSGARFYKTMQELDADKEKMIIKGYEEGGSVEVTSSVQDPKPTGANETAFTDTMKDAEQMAKGGKVKDSGGINWQSEFKKEDEDSIEENVRERIADMVEQGYIQGELSGEEPDFGGWWSVSISEDENEAEIRNKEVARLIREGNVSGYNPNFSWGANVWSSKGQGGDIFNSLKSKVFENGGGLDNFSSHTDEWFDELIEYIKTEKEIDPNFHKLVATAKKEATHKNLATFAKIMDECSCSNQKLKEKILGHIKNIQEGKYRKEFKNQYGGKGTGSGSIGKVSVASSFFDLFLQAVNYDVKHFENGGVAGQKKYVMTAYSADVVEDDFEEGESTATVSDWHIKESKEFDSKQKLIDHMNKIMYVNYKEDDFNWEDDEGKTIQTDVLCSMDSQGDFSPASEREKELWKKGEKKLYNCHYWFYVLPVTVHDSYAKGGQLGDSVHIYDLSSPYHGKAGLIMGANKNEYLLKVLSKGEEIDVIVPKSNTTPFPENID